MECQRKIIYFSAYRNGVKEEKAGYALLLKQGTACRIEYHCAAKGMTSVVPVYYFAGGAHLAGEPFAVEQGETYCVKTGADRFLGSEKSVADVEAVCLCGTPGYYSGGRVDGQELLWRNGEEEEHPAKVWLDMVTEAAQEEKMQAQPSVEEVQAVEDDDLENSGLHEAEQNKKQISFSEAEPEPVSEAAPVRVSVPELFSLLPGLSLPPDGVRQRCCRVDLADLARFPKKWKGLENNHFLLHGYYRYHHLMLAQVGNSGHHGTKYALGVPGEFYYRDQYMAETFGFSAFYPLKKGNCRRGEFGYWYLYLT